MKKNNKWRRRIIRLLEGLLKDLQRRPPSPEQAEVIDKLAALTDRADSMFEGIERVEVTESLYYTRPIEISNKQSRPLCRLKECLEDTAFAVYCFIQDATYLRMFSTRAWHDFALGSIGIQTATFCTNSADAHISAMSEELRKSFDHFEDSWTTRMHTKVDAFFRQQCCDDARLHGSALDEIKPSCEDVSFARHATRRLGYYASTLLCVNMTRLVFESFLAQQEPLAGVNMDQFCLLKSLYQLRSLERMGGEIASAFKSDCMHYAAYALVVGHIDTDAVYAAQMLHDIQAQVNPQKVPSEDIIENVSRDCLELYEQYGPIWKRELFSTTRSARTERMYERYSLLHAVVNTPCKPFVQDVLEKYEREYGKQYTLPGFQLIRHVPSLIGRLVNKYHSDLQNDFMDVTNDFGHILTVIHLYNAAKSSGALQTKRWEDIEWIIHQQSDITIFAGEPPTTSADYVRCFCQAYGLDSNKFAANRKLQKVESVKNDICLKGSSPRRLESCSLLARIALKGTNLSYNSSSRHQDNLKMLKNFSDRQLDWSSPHGKPKKIGILIAAKESFDSDEEAQSFDIFKFHLRCSNLLMSIRDMCLEEAPNDYPSIRFGGLSGVNPLLAELLRDLSDCPRHHERMWPKVVKLLSDRIEKDGSRSLDLASERMEMTTLDSISMDSDAASSDTAMETPSVESPRDPERNDAAQHQTSDRSDGSENQEQSRRHQILDLVNSSIRVLADGSSQLIALDGTSVGTLGSDELDSQRVENFIKAKALIKDCEKGSMTMKVLANGDMQFWMDDKPRFLVTFPNVDFRILE